MKEGVVITLQNEIYIPSSDRWTGGRDDVIGCREYDLDEKEATLIGTDKGHEIIIISRDNIASVVENDHAD